MALLAEEVVEEWLNRNGYFTIRGIKIGVHEIDLLAIAMRGASVDARHVEVQVSIMPVSYLCPLPRDTQTRTGRKPMSMKARSPKEMAEGVREWVFKKFRHEAKRRLRQELFPGEWTYELVVHKVKFPEELSLLEKQGVKILRLQEIVGSLSRGGTVVQRAAGSELLDLITLGRGET